MLDKHLVQGGRDKPQTVQAFEFDAATPCAGAPFATQADDHLGLALPDLPRRRLAWPPP
jgi:hypothetical protein